MKKQVKKRKEDERVGKKTSEENEKMENGEKGEEER